MLRKHRHLLLLSALTLLAGRASGGPPFKTDDPEPVDFRHWEFYLASVSQFGRSASEGTLPHLEINYGAAPNLQLHLIAPMGFVRGEGGTAYGFGATELGAKYRFAEESDSSPQIGVFPLVELPIAPTSSLDQGNVQAYLPLWVQKSWGKFTTYGGAGYWIDSGQGNRNWIFAGWQAQYDFSETVSLGGEVFYGSAQTQGGSGGAGFNLGGFINITEHDHILFSAGHSVQGEAQTTAYLGFQLTI